MYMYDDNFSVGRNVFVAAMSSIFIAVILGAVASLGAILLKLSGALYWSWWQVFLPVAIPFGIEVVAAMILVVTLVVSMAIERRHNGNKV